MLYVSIYDLGPLFGSSTAQCPLNMYHDPQGATLPTLGNLKFLNYFPQKYQSTRQKFFKALTNNKVTARYLKKTTENTYILGKMINFWCRERN